MTFLRLLCLGLVLGLLTFMLGPIVPAVSLVAAIWAGIFLMAGRTPRKPWMPLALALLVVSGFPAFADISVGQAFGDWRAYIDAAVSALITGLVGIVLALIYKKLGLSIEDSQRAALQTALTNGAGLALTKLGNVLDGKTLTTGHLAIDEAVNYVLRSAPAAIEKFGLTPDEVREKIIAKLSQVANTTTQANA